MNYILGVLAVLGIGVIYSAVSVYCIEKIGKILLEGGEDEDKDNMD